MRDVLENIMADPRYKEGITYGKPRKGHSEGTVEKHLIELEVTADRIFLNGDVSLEEYLKLLVLIHVHDTFKLWAKRDCPIDDENSHATLAAKFLGEFREDLWVYISDRSVDDMIAMVQWHDENYALWKQFKNNGKYNAERFEKRILSIKDMDLFLIFTIVDGFTVGKMSEEEKSEFPTKTRWFIEEVGKYRDVKRPLAVLEFLGL